MDFASMEKAMYGDVENDEELMAELLALEAEERAAGRILPTASSLSQAHAVSPLSHQKGSGQGGSAVRKTSGAYGISSISDASDEDMGDDDGSDGDIGDADLLAELSNLVEEESGGTHKVEPHASSSEPLVPAGHPSLVVDTAMLRRLDDLKKEYNAVLKSAKEENNVVRAKRYQRGLSRIEELVTQVEAGKAVDENDIPVSFKAITSSTSPTGEFVTLPSKHQKVPSPADARSVKETLVAAEGISSPVNSSANCEAVGCLLKGQQLKAELNSRRQSYIKYAKAANESGDKKSAFEYYTVAKQFDEAIKAVNDGQVTECEESELPPPAVPYKPITHEVIPPPPKTLLEGLEQRMQKYKILCEQCKAENNDRKFRMNSRILKHYEDAVRACRMNKLVDVSELPCPPGYPPLPSQGAAANVERTVPKKSLPEIGPLAAPAPSESGRQSRQKQQLDFLLKRQMQFKQVAIAAKNKGDIAAAKKFLLAAKGFDKMISASKAGLPVNIEKTPIPPQVQMSTKALKPSLGQHTSFDAAIEDIEGTPSEVYATMEKDLIYQVKLCEENRLAFTRLGDVTRVKLFETWSSISKRDLILLRELSKRGAPVPRFRYESRNIPSVEVCLDVDEHHIELSIIRVTDARLPPGWKPSDGYLFVKYNFAFPHDAHQIGKTKVVDATNSPEYNEKFLLTINRKVKQLQRVIKRNCLKFEVYQKGGFLRSDKLIGTADCKLSDLEEKAQIHESVDLMEGRKQVRAREPLGEKKLSLKEEKWLLLES